MKLRTAIACSLLLATGPSIAEDTLTFGIGARTCATVMARPRGGAEVRAWAKEVQTWTMGAWSALNTANSRNQRVGRYSDGMSIMQAIETRCKEDPGLQFLPAIITVYREFEKRGR